MKIKNRKVLYGKLNPHRVKTGAFEVVVVGFPPK